MTTLESAEDEDALSAVAFLLSLVLRRLAHSLVWLGICCSKGGLK